MITWRAVHVGTEGDGLKIGGVDVWAGEDLWRRVKDIRLMLPHPSYLHQIHEYDVYEIGERQRPVRFATSELSNARRYGCPEFMGRFTRPSEAELEALAEIGRA